MLQKFYKIGESNVTQPGLGTPSPAKDKEQYGTSQLVLLGYTLGAVILFFLCCCRIFLFISLIFLSAYFLHALYRTSIAVLFQGKRNALSIATHGNSSSECSNFFRKLYISYGHTRKPWRFQRHSCY